MARRIVTPSQVARFDGNRVFMEVMADSLSINKLLLNFCEYDKTSQKGSRMKNSIAIYIDIGTAGVLAEDILTGGLARKAAASREEATAKGSRYPREVFTSLGGAHPNDAGRADNKAESRQFLIVPGSKLPWILTAEKGPGHLGPTGLIVPDYNISNAECVIRIPMTDDSLKELALIMREMHRLWILEKFGELNDFDPSNLRGYNRFGMPKTTMLTYFRQCGKDIPAAEREDSLIPSLRMNFRVGSLHLGKLQLDFTTDPDAVPIEDKTRLPIYINITKAQVIAQNILSGRYAWEKKMQAKNNEFGPIEHILGGTTKNNIISRQLKLLRGTTKETKDLWVLQATSGPGHLSETGLIVPDYDDKTAVVNYRLCLTDEELKRFAVSIQDAGMLWTFKAFGSIVHSGFARTRKETEMKIAQIKEGNGNG